MRTSTKVVWIGFIIVALMIIFGIKYENDTLLFVGYVFGLPVLVAPLFILSNWSEKRKYEQKPRTNEERWAGRVIKSYPQKPSSKPTTHSCPKCGELLAARKVCRHTDDDGNILDLELFCKACKSMFQIGNNNDLGDEIDTLGNPIKS